MNAHPYGKPRYLDMRGPSIATLMKRVLAIKWAKDQQPAPVVKFATADRTKVRAKECAR